MKKILVIEDNLQIRENIEEILQLANYQVFTAENGKTGIEIALREKPDLIVCDIMMPELDGYGVLHLLNKNASIRNTPFIFLTAKTERGDMCKGMEMGADDYITKPFEETELLEAIESRLKKAELIREEFAKNRSVSDNAATGQAGVDVMQSLIQNRDLVTYKKKQIIYSEGNRPLRLYYIQKGKVKTYKANEDGKELVVGLYNEGEFLGYVAMLEGSAYKETAEALDNTELVVVPRSEFEQLMHSNRAMAHQFLTMMAKTITENDKRLLDMAYNSLRKKVAGTLMALHTKYKTTIAMSRENLATMAGTATESLIRTLTDFKNEKLIDISDNGIVILNEKKLENMVN